MNHSGLEVEIKLPAADPVSARLLLEGAGFRESVPRMFESNALWDWPEGSLRGRGELLRVRQIGDRAILTYKGRAVEGKHKTRPEIEVGLSEAAAFGEILAKLGLRSTYRYEKYRTEFSSSNGEGSATIDETPIGTFLELEGPPQWIDREAARLGFDANDYITSSYSTLYIEHCSRAGIDPGEGMIFGKTP